MKALVLALLALPGAAGANLVGNPGFETGSLPPWAGGANVTVISSDRHTGQYCARIANGGDMTQLVTTQPGVTYKLLAWVRIVQETGFDWGGFRIAVSDYDWTFLGSTGDLWQSQRGSVWFKIAITFTAKSNRTRIEVGYFGGPGRQVVGHVDDFELFVKGANQPPVISASLEPTTLTSLPANQNFLAVGDDPDGAIVRVLWEFGDGTRSLDPSGQRRVSDVGSYRARLTVVDDDGAAVSSIVPWSAQDSRWPSLTITEPDAPEVTVPGDRIWIRGQSSASVVRLASDRAWDASVSGGGAWQAEAQLRPGWNRILVQAHGSGGRITTREVRVRSVPSAPLAIENVSVPAGPVPRFDPAEITFDIRGSAATEPDFPYDPSAPAGVPADGITVDVVFSNDGFVTERRRPAFLHRPYRRAFVEGEEWMVPDGPPRWTVRFAPPEAGVWQFRIEAREAKGQAISGVHSFVAGPAATGVRGPVFRSPTDSRYFAHADGTVFLGVGRGIGCSQEEYSYELVRKLRQIGRGNTNLFRWWISGHIWGSAWQPWTSRTLGSDGYLPKTGHVLDRAYAGQLASLRLDAENPLMFQGFASGHAGLEVGKRYRVRVRWRTENVTGPARAGYPHGVCLKFVGWPEPGQTLDLPVLVPHVAGDAPWHVATAEFVAQQSLLPNLAVILENTTGGRAFVDEIALHEVLSDGTLGPQLLRSPRFNSHLTFDPRRAAGIDVILQEALAHDIHLKLVISEKGEWLMNHLSPEGLPDRLGGNFDNGPGTAGYWLHRAYWRYLSARYGAYRSVFGWELVNEAAPGPGAHFRLTAALARFAEADGNPHLASTSTWASLAEEAWKHPDSDPIHHTDFHCYVIATGWIEPRQELRRDSARFYDAYARASWAAGFGKPGIWGEMGIDDGQNEDPLLAQDTAGVWFHKVVWAGTGPGGVVPLYWWTENIERLGLDRLAGPWRRFLAGIPLDNGRYQDVGATSSHPDLRAFGQKDLVARRAHLWIDNARHTWYAVVTGQSIPAVSGTLTLAMGSPNAPYVAIWHSTATGQRIRTQRLRADAAGNVRLTVTALDKDIAVRLEPLSGAPPTGRAGP